MELTSTEATQKFNFMKYPTSFQTTDCVIVNRRAKKILLGRKPKKLKWCFMGGFVDPNDPSLEEACAREKREEAGISLETTKPVYLFSFRVDDERYRKGEDKILTAVFLLEYLFGFAEAGDDIGEVAWFDIDEFKNEYKTILNKKHWPIAEGIISRGII